MAKKVGMEVKLLVTPNIKTVKYICVYLETHQTICKHFKKAISN